MPKSRFRHVFGALVLLVAMLAQGTWALAGTTGGLQGTVVDTDTGAPVAGAKVTVDSPSQTASTTTDAGGHYVFLALAPDSYTVSVIKDGYNPSSTPGMTVFADSTNTFNLRLIKALKTIAKVTSRAAAALVKPGVTADTYNVNSAGVEKAAALGGGGNMDSAYSAIASVPGVNVPIGGAGWNNNAVYIRGNQSFFTSFEYDGVPVNRAFDNYNSSTESNLGLQELQVYTGGGPASNSSAGTSGFINQVIKTGTYPGFGTLSAGIGTDAFYHQTKVEAGGATPDRNFSWYVGLSGYNQGFRYIDNNDGASLFNLGSMYDFAPQYSTLVGSTGTNGRGVWPVCNQGTNVSPVPGTPAQYDPNGNLTAPATGFDAYGYNGQCYIDNPAAALFGNLASIADRENVVNLHFGIPHKNGLRDDLQLLWSSSAMESTYYSSPNDAGGYGPYTLAVTGSPYCPPSGVLGGTSCSPNYPSYIDAKYDYNLPFGTPIQVNGQPLPTTSYYQPSSNQNRAVMSQVPADLRDPIHNDTGIVKLQYTKALGPSAYARAFAYSFFSDWTQAGANMAWNCYIWGYGGPQDCGVAQNYDLITHTAGGELQLADQISPQHLLQFTANYTTATVSRFNNTGYIFDSQDVYGGSFVGYMSQANGQYTCYDPNPTIPNPNYNPNLPTSASNPQTIANANQGQAVGCRPGSGSPFWSVAGAGPYPEAPANTPAGQAGAQWVTLQNGSTYGTYNTVKPKFLFAALTDDFRPSDKLDFNFGLRMDRYEYNLAPLTPGTDFYSQIVTGYVCQNAAGNVLTSPLKPGAPPPAPVIYNQTCPAGYHHPSFSATSPSTYTLTSLSPRASFSYTINPQTVIRGEVGRYTEPPISASLQYLNSSGNALSVWNATLPLGFNSPFHPIPLQSAIQSDLSLEHQFRGTDVSFKLSPFFNYTNGYEQQAFIGPNFVTQVPVGAFRSYGVEAALSKGNFNQDGLSGQLAFTWTKAQVQYQAKYFGSNQVQQANAAIDQFNTLTKAGGGSPCYTPADKSTKTPGSPTDCSTAGAILNPYYNMSMQSDLDPNGWYAPGGAGLSATSNTTTGYFDSPIIGSLILNYKHAKFAITPSFQISEGSSYGGPYDVAGLDPRACTQNSQSAQITTASPNTNPLQCDYLTMITGNASPTPVAGQLFIPNPQTGSFAQPGQFRNPWIATMNLQLRYDLSPRVTVLGTLSDIWHTCFGGTKAAWTSAYPAGVNNCAYGVNGLYASNFYNGTSPADAAANGAAAQTWETQSYLPSFYGSTGSGTPWPFNAYFQLQIKL
jgi:hypothetical protein